MKITAVICEYNPFHNGHQYQLEQIRRKSNCDYIIVLMSGYFTQRGIPAITDPMLRTQMALLGGADLALQLPVLFSTASAPAFAGGSISILNGLGCVDMLAYGTEQDNALYQDMIHLLNEEPPEYVKCLKANLSSGKSYPSAMEEAVFQLLGKRNKQTRESFHNLFSPNNILGIEYEKALCRSKSRIKSFPTLRVGCGYHDLNCQSTYASASAIRSAINACYYNASSNTIEEKERSKQSLQSISHCMPEFARTLLEKHFKATPPITADDFSSMLYLALTRVQSTQRAYPNCSIDFLNRIKNNLNTFCSFMQFAELLKSKNITFANICRCLTYVLLDISKEDWQFAQSTPDACYARVLGFKKSAAPLLHHIHHHSSIPIISKLADAKNILPDNAMRILEADLRAAQLYHGVEQIKTHRLTLNEFQRQLVILP